MNRSRLSMSLVRRWADIPVRWKGLVVLAIPLVPLVLLAPISIWSRAAAQEAQAQVHRAMAARSATEAAFRSIVEAESAVRGFVLTRRADWLAPYDRARTSVPASLDELDGLARDPGQRSDLATLRPLIERRMELLAMVVRTARDPAAASPSDLLEQGNTATEALRRQFRAMNRREDALLAERSARAAAAVQMLWILTVSGIPLGIAGGIVGILLFTAGVSRRVSRLAQHAHSLTDITVPPCTITGADELGQLERRLAETAALLAQQRENVRVAHEELNQFFTLAPEMFCIAGSDGFFKRVNPMWTEILGWSTEELLARPYLEFIHPDDRAATIREAGALTSGAVTVHFENRYACKDGTYKWLQWKAAPVVDQHLIYAAARDVTLQKEADAAVQRAKDAADQASQAKSVFLSRMSHDLRTPLNAVLGFAQLLEMEAATPMQTEQTRHIIRAGRHLLELINEVLDIAHVESGRLSLSVEPISVSEVLTGAVELIQPLADQKGINIVVEAVPPEWHVLADRRRMMQVIVNLVSNAVKYNRDSGLVSLACVDARPGWWRISVTDTGFGLTTEQQTVVFEPFERLAAAQSSIEGTGLGLAVAKGFAEAMGGRIGIDSVPGQGSTFWVELPSSAAPVGTAAEAPDTAAAAPAANRGTVLYIEDNASNVRVLEGVLAHRPGVRLLTASDAATGLQVAQRHSPNLILLDMHLPDISGEDVLWRLRANATTRDIPVVALSADATHGRVKRMLASGARDYLTKPVDVARLLRLFDEYCPQVPAQPFSKASVMGTGNQDRR